MQKTSKSGFLNACKRGNVTQSRKYIYNIELQHVLNGIKLAFKYSRFRIIEYLIQELNMLEFEILITAITYNVFDIVKILVDMGIDVQYDDNRAIITSAAYGNIQIFNYLYLHGGANIFAKNSYALVVAVRDENFSMVQHLVKLGLDVNCHTGLPLAMAVYDHHIFDYLVKNGADLYIRDYLKLVSEQNGNPNFIHYLLDYGLPITSTNSDSLINSATEFGSYILLQRLFKMGAVISNMIYYQISNMRQFKIILNILMQNGLDIYNVREQLYGTVIKGKKNNLVKYLVQLGCMPTHSNFKQSFRVFDIDMIKYLVENAGCYRYLHKFTTLSSAVYWGRYDIVQYLVYCGTNIYSHDGKCLYIASMYGYFLIIDYLLSIGHNGFTQDCIEQCLNVSSGNLKISKIFSNYFNLVN